MDTATIHGAACALLRRGLPIVICDGKVPLGGEEWHLKPVTEENLPSLLRQARSPAIGLRMGDYIDIESDGPDEEALFAKLFEGCDMPVTPTYQSPRGKHRVFRGDERFRGTNRAVIHFKNGGPAKLGVRIGADGKAAQSVIPPSANREWLVSFDDAEPAELPSVVVDRVLAMLPKQKGPQNGPLSPAVSNAPLSSVAERARKYVSKIPGAVSGEGGHNATFHVACVLVVGFGLDSVTAMTVLREWNQTCSPPWDEWELQHKVDGANEQPGERGHLLTDHQAIQSSGTPTATSHRRPTDVGNAERFAEQHGADVRYCHQWNKWLVWDGRRWAVDNSGEVMRRAKLTARSIYIEASKIEDEDQREAMGKWAVASERRERLTAMIALAQSEKPIPIAVESLDAEAWLLNCDNGTVDLRTGELREHRREDRLTKLCSVEYPTEPGIDPELWLAFLNRIFDGNAKLIGFLQRLVGLALVGEVIEHILAIFYGVGANGKSVAIETVCGMLGSDYSMNAPPGLLMATKNDRHPTELADLHGKRFVAAVETADGGRLSEALVKELTGGDSIRARRMREDFWQFRPSHSVVLATNHRPIIRGTDHGIWRRIKLVPFVVTIPDHKQDKQLTTKLRGEWPAILRWAVAGCLDWQRNGLQAPDEVSDATSGYRADMDVLGEFIEDCCITGPNCEVRASDLYHRYRRWADARGEFVETQTKFGGRIAERGFEKKRAVSGHVVYSGIGLLSEGSE